MILLRVRLRLVLPVKILIIYLLSVLRLRFGSVAFRFIRSAQPQFRVVFPSKLCLSIRFSAVAPFKLDWFRQSECDIDRKLVYSWCRVTRLTDEFCRRLS